MKIMIRERFKPIIIIIFIFVIILFFVFSGSDRIKIKQKGSDTMLELAQFWAEEYVKINDNVTISISGGGSGTGIAQLIIKLFSPFFRKRQSISGLFPYIFGNYYRIVVGMPLPRQ